MFRPWLANLMEGRYGMDELNKVLGYITAAVIIISLFVAPKSLNVVSLILLIIVYFRCFSRNIYARQQENLKFLQLKSRFTSRTAKQAKTTASKAAADNTKRVLICPYCKEKLRVPVGAGTIKIKCPHCNTIFEETV